MSAYQSAQAEKKGYEYQAAIADNNAQIAEWEAQDAIQRGQTEEQNQRLKTASVYSSQRAAMAANGVDLTEGSPVDVLTSTKYLGERDALTIRDNSLKQAWGHRTQAATDRANATALRWQRDQISPFMRAGTSLLTSAGNISEKWYTAKKNGISNSDFWFGRT